MTETIIVAILSLIGTLAGAFLANSKTRSVIQFQIEDLTKKVERHNQVIERVFKLEGRMNEVEHDIRDLKAR